MPRAKRSGNGAQPSHRRPQTEESAEAAQPAPTAPKSRKNTKSGNYEVERGDTKHVTHPGETKFWVHTNIYASAPLLAVYLGYADVRHLELGIRTARACHVARIAQPFLCAVQAAPTLGNTYRDWFQCGSDAAFEERYDVGEEGVLEYIDGGEFRFPNGANYSAEDKTIAYSRMLVWAKKTLTAPVGAEDPKWKNGTGQLESYPESMERLADERAKERNKAKYAPIVIPEVSWTDEVRPKLIHYEQYQETEFEKYHRLVSFIRYCMKFTLQDSAHSGTWVKRVNGAIANEMKLRQVHKLERTEERDVMMRVLQARPQPVAEMNGPKWMMKRPEKLLPRRNHVIQAQRETPRETVDIRYMLVADVKDMSGPDDIKAVLRGPEPALGVAVPEHHSVIRREYNPADLSQFNTAAEWRDDMRLIHDFNHPKSRRQIEKIYLYHGEFEETTARCLDESKLGKWNLLYGRRGEEEPPWEKVKELLCHTRETKTIVIGHTSLKSIYDEDGDDADYDYPFESDLYSSSRPGETRSAPVAHGFFGTIRRPVVKPAPVDPAPSALANEDGKQDEIAEADIDLAPRVQDESGQPGVTFSAEEEETVAKDYFGGECPKSSTEKLRWARRSIGGIIERLRHSSKSTIENRARLFPPDNGVISAAEERDVNMEGEAFPSTLAEEEAAESVLTGSDYTKGLPIQICLEAAEAQPTGSCHNEDPDLKYYKSKLWPGYNDDEKDGVLAHQITASMSLASRVTGYNPKKMSKKSPNYNSLLFPFLQTTGYILADIMGLGKTHSLFMTIEYMGNKGFLSDSTRPVLIVCPDLANARQMIQKMLKYCPMMRPVLAHGTAKDGKSGIFGKVHRLPPIFFSEPMKAKEEQHGFFNYLWKVDPKRKTKGANVYVNVIVTTKDTYASRVLTGSSGKYRNKLTDAGRGFSVVVVDEVHELRNSATKAWQAVAATDFDYFIGMTASPVVNEPADLYNIVKLFHNKNWEKMPEAEKKRIQKISFKEFTDDKYKWTDPRLSPLRKAILNPDIVKKLFSRSTRRGKPKENEIYTAFASCFEEAFVIRRGTATKLDYGAAGEGQPVSLKHLLPRVHKYMFCLEHIDAIEKKRFEQAYHDCSVEFCDGLDQLDGKSSRDLLTSALRVHRELDNLSCSTFLDDLKVALSRKKTKRNTTVSFINECRRADYNLTVLLELVLKKHAPPVRTHYAWLEAICRCSPKLVAILRILYNVLIPSLQSGGEPQKIMIVEEVPIIAYLIELTIQHLFITCETMHSNLTETERQKRQDSFNSKEPNSLMVLVQLYNVAGSQGINLHECCSTVIVCTPGYSLPTEQQAVSRTIRVSQKKDVYVNYLHLKNSHDDWKLARQQAKQMPDMMGRATRDRWPDLASLMSFFNAEISTAHDSELGKLLKRRFKGDEGAWNLQIEDKEKQKLRKLLAKLNEELRLAKHRRGTKAKKIAQGASGGAPVGHQRRLVHVMAYDGAPKIVPGKRSADQAALAESSASVSKRPKTVAKASPGTSAASAGQEPEPQQEPNPSVDEGLEISCSYSGRVIKMRTKLQWMEFMRTNNLLGDSLLLELCDVLKLLAIPKDARFQGEHLRYRPILERAAECAFRVRKMITYPLLTKFSPRIQFSSLQPSVAAAIEARFVEADIRAEASEVPMGDLLSDAVDDGTVSLARAMAMAQNETWFREELTGEDTIEYMGDATGTLDDIEESDEPDDDEEVDGVSGHSLED